MMEFSMSVSQLNEYVRRSLAGDPMLRRVYLSGEIGTLKLHSSGHWYFTLKDEEASINCAMFRQNTYGVRFHPENGQKVRLIGSVGLYSKTGSYQFYAEAMELDGLGDLFLRFDALKRKLEAQGLFDASLKKPLPLLPCGIGIITSETGAVVHDIASVIWRRFPGMPLFLYPVKVQGEGAAEEIAEGIARMDSLPETNVLIVGRGGGSMEDLWPFNEEIVAQSIARCHKPVISAVGHETDFTIADFVADVRAATPSMAAELAVPLLRELQKNVRELQYELIRALRHEINVKRLALNAVAKQIEAQSPVKYGERMLEKVNHLELSLRKSFAGKIEKRRFRLEQAALRVRSAGPETSLERGYALVSGEGRFIRSVKELSPGQRVSLRFRDGSVNAVIEA